MRVHTFVAAALVSRALLAEPAPPAALQIAADTATVLAWPLQLKLPEAMVLGGAAIGTVALLRADVRLYRRLDRMNWTLHDHSIFNYTLRAGDGLVDLAAAGAFAFAGERGRQTSIAAVEALASVAATSALMKHIFRVPRPDADPSRKTYFRGFGDDALPSGHTMSAFAMASVISAQYPRAAPVAYATAALVGLSVMKRGWHWPSDVLAGGALGALIGRVSVRINQRRFSIAPAPGGVGLSASL